MLCDSEGKHFLRTKYTDKQIFVVLENSKTHLIIYLFFNTQSNIPFQ